MLPGDFPTDKIARRRFLQREHDMREAKYQGYRPQTEQNLCEGSKRVVVDMSKNPKVKAFVKRFDPTYRKRKVGFNVGVTSVELHSGFWSDGSRTEWHGVLENGDRYPLSYPTAPPQFGGGRAPKAKIGRGTFVAQGGVFRGKQSTYTFHVTTEFAQAMGVS